MTVPHPGRLTGDRNLDGTAETAALVRRIFAHLVALPRSVRLQSWIRGPYAAGAQDVTAAARPAQWRRAASDQPSIGVQARRRASCPGALRLGTTWHKIGRAHV